MKAKAKELAESVGQARNGGVQSKKKQQQQLQSQQQQLLLSQSNQMNSSSGDNKQMLAKGESLSVVVNEQHHPHSGGKERKMSNFSKGKWILIISMAFALIITAILVSLFSLLDQEDQCFNNLLQQQTSYKLFSTKTTYSSAYNHLNNSRNQHYQRGANRFELPEIFSKSDSLKSLHDKLTSSQPGGFSCKVRQFHYFGRHASRFPDAEQIEQLNRILLAIQTRIDLSKFSLNSSSNNNNITTKSTTTSNSSADVCFNPLAQYKQWTSFMVPEQDNLVMDSGADETLAIAQRFKAIYPEMFDANQSRIEIGVTEELRTAQTALAFIRQLDNFHMDFCNLDQFPPESFSSSSSSTSSSSSSPSGDAASRARQVATNECLSVFLRQYRKEKLEFHKKCRSYHHEDIIIPKHLDLKEPNKTKFISNSVSKKLKLTKDDQLTPDEVHAIYNVCKYESAFAGQSIWCNLFAEEHLKFYEYINDLDDYFNQAYGHPDQRRSACPATTDLMRSFKAAARNSLATNLEAKPEAHFYFTHSEVIQKMLAASVDLGNDPNYESDVFLPHLRSGTTPESRQWRSSLFTPFSANLAFTLYECPRVASSSGSSSATAAASVAGSRDESINFDFDVASPSSLKVVASLNEQPIKLDGCSGFVCDLMELTTDSRIDSEKRCRLEEICRKNIVVT